MKTLVVVLVILCALGSTYGEYLYEDFEGYPVGSGITPARSSTLHSDWTLEALVRIGPGQTGTCCLFEWGAYPNPVSTDDCWIRATWTTNGNINVSLREWGRSDDERQYIQHVDMIPADDKWHHCALVKSASQLEIFVDYDLKMFTPLETDADGSYGFNTSTHVTFGNTLTTSGGSYATEYAFIDELRFSWDDLSTASFVQLGDPYFTQDIEIHPTSPWYLYLTTRPFKQYRAYMNTGLGKGGIWNPNGSSFWPTQFVTKVQVNMPGNPAGAFQLREQ